LFYVTILSELIKKVVTGNIMENIKCKIELRNFIEHYGWVDTKEALEELEKEEDVK